MKGKHIIRRLAGQLKAYKATLIGAILCALTSVPLALMGPVYIGRAIDAIVGQGNVDFETVIQNIVLLGATAALAALLQWVMLACTRSVSAKVAQQMRQQAFDAINKAPLKEIDTHPHGDLVSRMVNDADAVSEGLLQALTQLIPGVVTIVMTVVLMLTLQVGIALLVIVLTPVSFLFAKYIAKNSSKNFRDMSAAQGKLSSIVNETVGNQSLVRAFNAEDECAERFARASEEFHISNYKAILYSSVANPGTRFVNAIVYAAAGVTGALMALRGGITVGGVSAFLAYANQYTKPFNEVTAVLTQMQSAVASAGRLYEVIDWQPEKTDAADALAPESCEGEVVAEHVFFAYDPKRPLIQDFTMQAKPGMRVALVGPTGCGKTTLINLLMRFYEVNAGVIKVDGVPINNIQRNALRGLYGMVLQETWLKEGTVRENIAYARPDATIDEVKAAAKEAYAHGFIKRLPQGYDTVIESGGGNLSAGQKQLLCIARIMLAKPDMLILDEATSSIDTRTEMLIQKALERLMQGHTSFVVAHRLSTIQTANMILVMNAGRIVEQGTHEELLAQDSFYKKLYTSQFAVE